MYVKKIDNQWVVKRTPNWYTKEGKRVSDDFLRQKGYYPLDTGNKPTYDPETQRCVRKDSSEWIEYKDRVEVTYTVEDIPDDILKQRRIREIERELNQIDEQSIADIRKTIVADDADAKTRLSDLESQAESLRTEKEEKESELEATR